MSWYSLPANVPWLTLALVIPLAGALLVALTPGEVRRVVKQLGVLSAVITLVLVLAIIGGSSRRRCSGFPRRASAITSASTASASSCWGSTRCSS